MSNMIQAAREQVAALTQAAYERAAAEGLLPAGAEVKATIEIPKDTSHGDYASSYAMAGARALHQAPRAIAQTIVDHLDLEGSYFQKVEIAGPGFLNFTLGPKWYQAVLADVEREGTGYGSNSEGGGEKVMVEFVSANPTGPMHMGNARGGVLGDTLANVLKRDGCDTWKEFYVNDAGNQIHKFAVSINARYMQLILGEENFPFPEEGYHGEDIKELAADMGMTFEDLKNVVASLHEFNPMMGHRGCRLAVTYPEIAKMQTKAVIRAAINVKKAHADWNVCPEIMIPLICDTKELKYVKKIVVETADAEIAAAGVDLKYEVGTMIEIPRAALTADEIAKDAEFFCFGTNDLTQMTYGFSRDDAGKFLNAYYDAKIFENDPFAKLDQTGVGKLMEMAIKLGKATRPELHVGICGEHGGDPSSVEFCHKIGLDYVSCSPFRVPIARLAAAQAALAD